MNNLLFFLNETQSQSPTQLILPFIAMLAFIWWFGLRPQRKRQKELNYIQYSIKIGDWVVNQAGMYGKVIDILDETVMVEYGTNKGVRVPIQRSSILGISEPNMTVTNVDSATEVTEVKED